MSNQWFRFYTEFSSDPKVQSMDEAMQRRLVMLFCLHGSGQLESLTHDEIAFALRIDIATLHATLQLFQEKGFCDEKGRLKNWDKRQYKSDNSTERSRKSRAKSKTKKDATGMQRCSNSDATPPDTEADTDNTSSLRSEVSAPTDPEKAKRKSKPEVSLDQLSVNHIAGWLAEKHAAGQYLNHDAEAVLEKFKNYCKSKGKRYADYIAAYRNAFDWERCQPTGGSRGYSGGGQQTASDRAKAAVVRGLQAHYAETTDAA